MNLNETTQLPPTSGTFTLIGGRTLPRVGFGMMRLTGLPGNFGPYPDWSRGLDVVRAAYGAGARLFDSARSYGPLFADRLLGEALADSADAFLATKGGVDKPAPGQITVDGSPATLRREIEEARHNLRRDTIDLFQLHRVDPNTSIEDSVEALDRARQAGWIDHIGLSNVTVDELERAMGVAPIATVQNRLNASDQRHLEMVELTRGKGIAFLPYAPLDAKPMEPGARLEPAKALRWLLELSDNVIVIPGTTSARHAVENAGVLRS